MQHGTCYYYRIAATMSVCPFNIHKSHRATYTWPIDLFHVCCCPVGMMTTPATASTYANLINFVKLSRRENMKKGSRNTTVTFGDPKWLRKHVTPCNTCMYALTFNDTAFAPHIAKKNNSATSRPKSRQQRKTTEKKKRPTRNTRDRRICERASEQLTNLPIEPYRFAGRWALFRLTSRHIVWMFAWTMAVYGCTFRSDVRYLLIFVYFIVLSAGHLFPFIFLL